MSIRDFNMSDWAISNRSLVTFMMIVIIASGAWSYVRLGRNEDPPFTLKTMIVEAYWPGATIDETLQQVTERIEKKLQEVPNLDYVRGYTAAGKSTIFVNLKDSTRPRDVPDAWYQVRKKINDIRQTFPQGVVGPGFNDEFGDTFGLIYAFTANGFTHRELRDYVERARSRLLREPDVSKVEIFGAQDERIYIEFSTQRLSDLHVDRGALIRALQAQNAITPAGTIQSDSEKIAVRVSGRFTSEEDIKQVNFLINNQLFRLTDLGEVKRGYADPPQPLFRVNGTAGIALGVSMRDGGDVLALGKNIQRAMDEFAADLPLGIDVRVVANQSEIVSKSVGEFMEALWEAVAIVMGVSLLSLGLRAGSVVALTIPIVFAVVFVAMDLLDISLQRVSLGALIIALGLLVDDAMITVESMVTKLEEGWDKSRAAVYAYATTYFPMGTGTLVTIAGFIPIGLAQSSAGEYTFSLFAVVAISLVVSWFVAAIFAPLIGVWLLKDPKAHDPHGHKEGRVILGFRRVLTVVLRARWVTVGLTLALFALSLVGARFIPQQFFPPSDRVELLVDLKLPQNASAQAMQKTAEQFDGLLKGDADIDHWTTYVGRGAPRFYLPMLVQLPNDFVAQAVLVTKSLEARERVRAKLELALAEKFPSLVTRVYPLEMGPPVGWPVQYRLSGPDPNRLRQLAMSLSQKIAENHAVGSINFDWVESGKSIRINVDQDQARTLGISSEQLAQSMNIVLSGVEVTQIRDHSYLIDVIARAGEDERMTLSTLRNLKLLLPDDRIVPLMQIATIGYGQEQPLIWRRDRVPTLTVQADIVQGVQPETVVAALAPQIAQFGQTLPSDYHVDLGGSVEESMKSQMSVAAVVPLMLLVMLTILMMQFGSFQLLFLALSAAPLGLIGVVAALLVSGRPLGFIALLGVVALVGMIVRNSVILIIQIQTEIERGSHPWDAVLDATSHRFRPILLTATAAILAMIPIAPTVFWGPMAFAIIGGLAVATALTLIFLPALYVIWFRVKEPKRDLSDLPLEVHPAGH